MTVLFYYLWWLHYTYSTCKYYHLQNFVHFDKYSKEYHILQDSLIQMQFEITSSSVVMEPIKSIKEY